MEKLSWKTEKRFVKDLMIAEINPRKISPEQKEALTKSLEKFNLADIPVLNTDNTIISGNQRLQILYELGKGDEKIDVRVPNRKLNDEELKEYMLIANTHAGVFDVELLDAHFEDVNIDFDIQLVDDNGKITVKGHERVKKGLTEDDQVPEPPKIAKSKPGQIFILGMHRLMCGDSTKKEDVELLMDGVKADMVFTDPPYNVDYGNSNNPRHKSRTILNDKKTDTDWDDFVKSYMSNLLAFTNGNIYISMSDKELGHMQLSFEECGGRWASFIIWVKDRLVLSGKDYHSRHETILYGWNEKVENRLRVEDRTQDDVWEIKRPSTSDLHPTMKPIELIERMLTNSTRKGMNVLDLFLGSGSTLIACEQTDRTCYGMELDPIYVDVIIKRWQDFTGQKAILEENGQEFDSFN